MTDDGGSDLVLDPLTWKLAVYNSLGHFLGVTGEAIPVDFLHFKSIESWIRVPANDMSQVWTALSGAATTIDTSNGSISASINVIRVSRYLAAVIGPKRGNWT